MHRRILALLAASCLAAVLSTAAEANCTPPPAQSGGQRPATDAQPPAKKVWTNDDMGELRDHSTISTSPNAKTAQPARKPSAAAIVRNESWYRDQIAKLRAKIPPLEEKIARLQAALEGHQVNEARQYGWVKPGNWGDQKAQLEKNRDAIQSQISELEDEARHKGNPANALP
jgi:hypothetical protein